MLFLDYKAAVSAARSLHFHHAPVLSYNKNNVQISTPQIVVHSTLMHKKLTLADCSTTAQEEKGISLAFMQISREQHNCNCNVITEVH